MQTNQPESESSNRLADQARCRASDGSQSDSESTISEDLRNRNGPPVSKQVKPVLPAETSTRRPLGAE